MITPVSFALIHESDTFYFFDSHNHSLHSALFGRVPVGIAGGYWKYFFTVHYPDLHVDVEYAKSISRFTELDL